MIKPDIPDNEKNRIQALEELGILDSKAEERFDRLTRLAARYFNVKTCLISLVDNDRQWFKSKFGLQSCETSRDISFCGHAILQDEIMVVNDATKDERFADNPLVTGEPYIVFYAGVPIKSAEGFNIGSLCINDDKPRTLDPEEVRALRDFADIVEQELNDLYQKLLQQERLETAIRTQHMLAVFPDIVFIFQNDLRYVASNEHPDLYLPKDDLIGRNVREVLPHDIASLYEDSLTKAFKTGDLINFRYQLNAGNTLKFFEARAQRISKTEVLVVVRNTTEEYLRMVDLERLSIVAQQTTNGVVITDLDGKVLWINEAFTRISGFSIDEMLGQKPGEVLQGPDTDPETIQRMREAINLGESFSVDIINHHKNGHSYWMRIVCNPWQTTTGELKGFIALQSDITQEIQNIEKIKHSQQLITAVIDANAIGTWFLNLQTRTLEINEQWAKLLGYTLDELTPVNMDTWQNLTHPEDLKKCLEMFEDYDKGLIDYFEASIRMKHKEGHWVWIRTNARITSRTEDGRAELTLGTHLDINAQMLTEAHLQEQYDYMQVIYDNMIDGIVIIDSQYYIQVFNPASELTFSYSHEEILNKNISILIPGIHKLSLTSGQLQYSEGRRKSGDVFPMEIGIVKSKYKQQAIFICMLRDVTERKNAEEAIHRLAYYDALSDLPNRRLMFDRLQHALHRSVRNKKHVAILFIDFDNFKQINDSAGHEIGDVLLQKISARLKGLVRESDTVARLGGDEFLVILENLDECLDDALRHVEAVAQIIKAQLNVPFELNEFTYIGSCSIGIALCDDPSLSPTEFIKQADLAMYQAKLAGKNAISFFAVEMQEKVDSRIMVEQDLRSAIANNEFEVFYQTQVDVNGNCIGAEGLLRWRHPQRGLVPPMEFISIAEESRLIIPIGHWVLEQACMSLVRWSENQIMSNLVLAINVSVVELSQSDWVESVLNTVRETGADPRKLKLEVTESVMAFDIEKVKIKLSSLRKSGISISLDDFGTGYSSLTYLKSLPLNQLKIDQNFVRDILLNPDDKAIAETIINLAKMMRLDVIAEGVETKDQMELLKSMGCQAFQGYLFGKPESLEHFELNNCLKANPPILAENIFFNEL